MKWRVPDQEVDQRKLGERLCKMYKGIARLSIDELFERDVNIKETRGHTLRLKKKQSVRDVYTCIRNFWLS